MLTLEQFKKCFPNCKEPDAWHAALSKTLPKYGIDSKLREAFFLSQCAHESSEFNTIKENLNYSAERLVVIFKKYFPTLAAAQSYGRKPEMIANRVYANRIGNGPESSGDGWKYRGRGIIQLTGRANYAECSKFLFGDERLLDNPDMLLEKEYAIMSACWFWDKNKLNAFADKNDFVGATKRINGGTIGLEHRTQLLNKVLTIA